MVQHVEKPFLQLAEQLANAAAVVVRRHFRTPIAIADKDDASPVTIADRDAESAMRTLIEATFPSHGIIGEEFGAKSPDAEWVWVLDPIDGTKSFITGRPTFGTLIALCKDGVPVMGVIDQPILKERWIGAKSMPTTFNGAPVKTRPCGSLKEAVTACTSPRQIETLWPRLYTNCKAMVWGGDCYSYGLIASGFLDLDIETGLGTYDYAALPPIVEGAGGWMGDWEGNPLTLSSDGRTIAMGDPALKNAVLEFIHH